MIESSRVGTKDKKETKTKQKLLKTSKMLCINIILKEEVVEEEDEEVEKKE